MIELICPYFYVTYYPVTYPTATDGIVLLGSGDYVEKGGTVSGQIGQLIAERQGVRGSTPAYSVRGQKQSGIGFECIKRVADPGEALATVLEIGEDDLSGAVGWLKIEVPGETRSWRIEPAVMEGLRWEHDARAGLLRLNWTLRGGLLVEVGS